MGYRLPDKREFDPHLRHIPDVATHSLISVDNGTISKISIPCFYGCGEYHDKMIHDHFGWPHPGHPDRSCQLPPCYSRVLELNEIDLPGEGYEYIDVAMLNAPSGLTFTGSIDYNIVTLTIVAMCNGAKENDIEVPFSVFAVKPRPDTELYLQSDDDDDYDTRRDVVTKGTLRIVAGII